MWVGLGGYSPTSPALEQIGSEADCRASGRVVSSVWYELVPAASRTIRMTVAPGDYLTAAVTGSRHDVHLQIDDVTRRTSFQRTLRVARLDVSSAEWIVEAPSVCSGNASCQELALANFGSAQFSRATVVKTGGGSAFTVTYANAPSPGSPAPQASSRTASVLARPRVMAADPPGSPRGARTRELGAVAPPAFALGRQ